MTTLRWTYCVALAVGAWLLPACTGLRDLAVPFAPMADAVAVAVGLVVFATLALMLRLDWNGWATLLIAAWAAAASSMLRATQALLPLLLVSSVGLLLCAALLLSGLPRQRRRGGRSP
jgi:hypothetical protein